VKYQINTIRNLQIAERVNVLPYTHIDTSDQCLFKRKCQFSASKNLQLAKEAFLIAHTYITQNVRAIVQEICKELREP